MPRYLLPLFGMLWGALFLHEAVTSGMLAGMVFILGSVLLVNDVRSGGLIVRREALASRGRRGSPARRWTAQHEGTPHGR